MLYRLIAPLAAALVVVCCFAEEDFKAPTRAAAVTNPVPADHNSIAQGKSLYQKNCQSCQGASGQGNGPGAANLNLTPTDLSDSSLWNQTDGELFWKITEGKKPMPRFGKMLTDEQRWNVVNYIRTLAPRPTTRVSSDDGN